MAETDPYLTATSTSIAATRRWVVAALVASAVYLSYRVVFTVSGAPLDVALLLLAAEGLAVAVFGLRAAGAWHAPAELVEVPDAPLPSTTVVVDAAGADPDALRTTLVSCRQLRGLERIVVADPAASTQLRTVADRFGATTVDDVATTVAAQTSAMWVLLVRAGDLPLPDALELLAAACSSPDAGIIQLGVEEANPSSFEHDPTGRWSLTPFDHQVVRPSLAATGSIPWYGDVPAMVRPAAIRDADDTGASTIDLGLHALSIGYRVTMVPRTLARLRGARTLDESVRQRFDRTAELRRRARGRLGDVSASVRRPIRLALADPLAAVRWVLLVFVAVLVLSLGRLPMNASLVPLALLAAPAYGLRWRARSLLGRGRFGRVSVLRSELRSVGVDLAFGHGLGERSARNHVLLLGAMVVAVGLAVAIGAAAVWRDGADRMPAGAAAASLALSAGFLIVAADVLFDVAARRQRRGNHRVRLDGVGCRLDDHPGRLHDLSTGGCGLIVSEDVGRLRSGDEVTVQFRIPDAGGAWRDVATTVRVAHVGPPVDGERRIGAAFADPTGASLDPVIEFLTIDRRLVALGRLATAS
ncbi:MAG: PilZ domain-containing protein [Actinomycetota bacterium]